MYRRRLLRADDGDDITGGANVKTTGREYTGINPTLQSYCATNHQMRRKKGGDVPRSNVTDL